MVQFPLAFKAVAERSEVGHKKYADIDQDYQGFTRTPFEEYQDALVRHLMQDGEPHETELDHLKAVAWNAVAMLEIKLREENISVKTSNEPLKVYVVASAARGYAILDRDCLVPGCEIMTFLGSVFTIKDGPDFVAENMWRYEINGYCTWNIGDSFTVKSWPNEKL